MTAWLSRLFGGRRMEERLDAELRDHVERHAAALMASGLDAAEARRRAALEFGGIEQIKEQCRDARGTRWVEDLVRDAQYGLRILRRSPAFTLVSVLSLALGIGANTAIFTLVDAVLLKTLPVHDPDRLVLLVERAGPREILSHSMPAFQALGTSDTLEGLCAFRPRGFRIATPGGPESVHGQLVSGACFPVVGIPTQVGRAITTDDDRPGAVPVAVISDGLWRRYFGADPAVLGRTIDIEGRAATIVGVTAREFFGLEPGRAIDVTLPLRPMQVAGSPLLSPRAKWLRLIGRLAPGVPRETAAADLDRLWRQAEMANGSKNAGGRLEAMSGAQGLNDLRREYSLPLRLLTLGVAALLVLACANLGSLLLARGRAREHEIGLRLALGAGRGRIVRQLLTESMILSAAGGLVGLAFANWGTGTIVSLLSRGRTPIEMDLALDLRVLAFTATVSLATGVVLGLLPSFRAAHRDLQPQLQASTRSATRHDRMRHAALVGVQTALSLVLVSGAVLFGRSLIALHRVDVGFEKDDVLLVGAPLRRLIPELQRRLHDLPNVRSVTLLMDAPPAGVSWTSGFSRLDGAPGSDTPMASFNFVGPRFFETLGIPLLEGRDFNADDDDRADHVAIVNQGLASRYFPGGSARGQRIRIGATVAEIVGVAKDVRYRGIRESAPDVIYRPYLQQPDGYGLSFAIRSDMPLPALADLVRREVRAAAPDIPVPAITPLDALYDGNITSERLLAVLSGFFGGMALVLVAIGVYGTLACDISRRRHEIGVRMALGADLRAIRRLLVGGALGPVAVGISVGLPAALAAGSLARRVLFGISASDPIAYGLCALVLLAIAVAAAWMPARRAGRIDPATSFGVYFG